MSQTVEYVVKVNGAQQGAAQVAIVEKSLVQADVAAKRAGASIDRAAAPTRNLGQAGLEASRAIEDLQYGFNGIVNNIPSLVMGLGASAGVAGALSLVAVGANQVIKYLNKEMPDAAAEGAKTIKIEIEGLNKDLQDMALELRSLASGDSIRRLRAEAIAASSAEEARIAGEAFRERFGDLSQRDIANQRAMYEASKTARDIVDAYDQAYAVGEKAAKAQAAFVRTIQIEQMRQLKDQEAIDEKNEARAMRRKQPDFKIESGDDGAATSREEREQRQREAANERALERQLRADDKAARAAEKAEAARTKALEREARERERIREREAEHAARLREQEVAHLQSLGSEAASAIGTFAAQSAMGQEAAFENLVAAASQQAGSMIMLEGGKVMAAGIAGMMIAPNPASALQIAGGAGLVAVGAAVQEIGPSAVSMMSSAMGGGGASSGGGLGSGASQAARDPGASPRGSGASSGGGGPMIINVAYGAGGPLPEDIAREIGRVVRSGDRRRGAS